MPKIRISQSYPQKKDAQAYMLLNIKKGKIKANFNTDHSLCTPKHQINKISHTKHQILTLFLKYSVDGGVILTLINKQRERLWVEQAASWVLTCEKQLFGVWFLTGRQNEVARHTWLWIAGRRYRNRAAWHCGCFCRCWANFFCHVKVNFVPRRCLSLQEVPEILLYK